MPSVPTSNRPRSGLARVLVGLGLLAVSHLAETQPPPTPPGQIPELEISGGATRVAIPDCMPRRGDDASREACRTIGQVLRNDLRFTGLFQFVPEALLAAIPPQDPNAPNFEDWKSIGAGILVATRAEALGATGAELAVELKVYYVETGQSMLAKRYAGTSENPRIFAHQASDDIVALTQYRGIARTKLVFVSDRDATPDKPSKELYIVDYDGHNPRRLTVNRSLNILPAWSPDGRSIAYVSYRRGSPQLYLAAIYEGRNTANLTREEGGQAFGPTFSPDGRQIAFASNRSGNMDVWVANADGTGARRLTQSPASDLAPCWSPTSREIAFTSNRGGTPQIYVMDAEGLNVRRLTTLGNHNDSAAWNPSREFAEIAFTARLESGKFDIAVLDLVTHQVRQITQGRGSCEYPAWAPNGRHLAFSCSQGRGWQLTLADRDGRNLQAIAVGPGSSAQPDWSP